MSRSRALLLSALLVACGGGDEEPSPGKRLSRAELLKPETCKECHSEQYRQWSGSMHAYAADDPMFLAMNARGQEETQGALGDLCVGCHAPMAVAEKATTDGLNLGELPQHLKGVTCYFCHNVDAVEGTHNNPLRLAGGVTLRGGFDDPVESNAHGSVYSPLMDRNDPASATLCGSCHDIMLPSPPAPAPVHLERTFSEWQGTVFAAPPADGGLTCNSCHMQGRDDVAAQAPGVKLRRVYSHDFPAVDVALGPFPEREAQRERVQNELDFTLRFQICVAQLPGAFTLELTLENVSAGHNWPSGAAQDRRAWAEVRAFEGSTPIFESGVVGDDAAVTSLADPHLWLLRDKAFDAQGNEAHMFWNVASLEHQTIPGATTFDPSHPDYFITHVPRRYPATGSGVTALPGTPDRVTLRVRMRPVGFDVIDDLVQSGHLDSAVKSEMPTFDLIPQRDTRDVSLEWTPAASQDPNLGFSKLIDGVAAQCVTSATAQR